MTFHPAWLLAPGASALVLWLDARCRPRVFWAVVAVGAAGFTWLGSRAIGLEPASGALAVVPLLGGLIPPLVAGYDVRSTSGQMNLAVFRWLSAAVCFWMATVAVVLICHYSLAGLAPAAADSQSIAEEAAPPPTDSLGLGAGADRLHGYEGHDLRRRPMRRPIAGSP
jgi:hypothetical protein